MNNAPSHPDTKAIKQRGRRPGRSDARELILTIAQRRFRDCGYRAVTLRSVAAEAGVDVALISYYFGSKKGLFGAAFGLRASPPEVLAAALPGDPARLAARLLRALITTWDDPQRGSQLRALVVTAASEPALSRLIAEVFEHELFGKIAEHLPGRYRAERAAAAGTQLAGVVLARYVLRLEPLASMPADELIRCLTPGLDAVLLPGRDKRR
jgi:AcrR family transcriptional regulator